MQLLLALWAFVTMLLKGGDLSWTQKFDGMLDLMVGYNAFWTHAFVVLGVIALVIFVVVWLVAGFFVGIWFNPFKLLWKTYITVRDLANAFFGCFLAGFITVFVTVFTVNVVAFPVFQWLNWKMLAVMANSFDPAKGVTDPFAFFGLLVIMILFTWPA